MKNPVASAVLPLVLLIGCGGSDEHADDHDHPPSAPSSGAAPEEGEEADHEHAETSLGTVRIGELDVELAQGHGAIEAGKEGHLVVKLPYTDGGATIVRAWIGTQDRTLSFVGKGEYAASHDDYDVHATAPDPLPEDARWWIEIDRPDGTKLTGSATPRFE